MNTDTTDIVKLCDDAMSSLARYAEDVRDSETANDCIHEFAMVDELLRQTEVCGEFACRFCLLEAATLVKIARMGVEVDRRADMVAWLASKSDAGVAAILDECSTGVRVSTIKGRETKEGNAKRREESQIAEHKRISEEILEELEDSGHTVISVESWHRRWRLPDPPDMDATHAFVQNTRVMALASGGAGLGNDEGDYLLPEIAKRDEVAQMIQNRLRSIRADLLSLSKLCKRTSLSLSREDADTLVEVIRGME